MFGRKKNEKSNKRNVCFPSFSRNENKLKIIKRRTMIPTQINSCEETKNQTQTLFKKQTFKTT